MSKPLAVGMCFYNPFSFEVMNENIIRTCEHLIKSWKDIYVIELTYTHKGLNQDSIKYRLPEGINVMSVEADSLMWHKEQLLNKLGKYLAVVEGYENIAMFDADILFRNEDWPQRILATLKDFKLIQCFRQGKSGWKDDNNFESEKLSLLARWFHNQKFNCHFPGGAWAARAEFWKDLGLFEYNIVGGGDSAFTGALLNVLADYDYWDSRGPSLYGDDYRREYLNYRLELNEYTGSSLYYTDQEAVFQVHGARSNRSYVERQQIIEGIDLKNELRRNRYNLTEWTNPDCLRAKITTAYFKSRNVDDPQSTDCQAHCICLNTCIVDDVLIKEGTTGIMPLSKINKNFKVSWRV